MPPPSILDGILAQVESVDGIDLTAVLAKDELSSVSCSFACDIDLIVL